MTTPTRATSFERWAAEYDRYRPGYPSSLFDEIADVLALPQHPRVADLGAGTGIATFSMAERGWTVTAVEPASKMLDVLRSRAGDRGLDVTVREGSAETSGMPDSSVDLAVAAQAFHWFDRRQALREMARIVRPGGGVALFWNVRDAERSPLVADYEALIGRYFGEQGIGQYLQHGRSAEHAATSEAFAAVAAFDSVRYAELRQRIDMEADDFVGMAFTASYIRALPDEEQTRLRAEIRDLLARHGVERQHFAIPYRIDLWTARRNAT